MGLLLEAEPKAMSGVLVWNYRTLSDRETGETMSEDDSTQTDESLKMSLKNAKEQVEGLKELVPQQISDEIKLATTLLKSKGIRLGVAAGLAAAALVVLLLFVIAIVVTLVNVLSLWMPGWAAGLIVAGFFLLIVLVLALVGYSKIKKALPLTPDAAIRGIRHDIGVLKEGSQFDESTLDQPRKPKSEDEDSEEPDKEPKPPAPSADELILRTKRRRRQIQALRDNLEASVRGPKGKIDRARRLADQAGSSVSEMAAKARGFVMPSANPDEELTEAQRASQERIEKIRPVALMSAGALLVLGVLRKVLRKS